MAGRATVMLFGGAQGSGKSSRAEHLCCRCGWHIIQGDQLDSSVIRIDVLKPMSGRGRLEARMPVYRKALKDALDRGATEIVFETALFTEGQGVPAADYRQAVLAEVPEGMAKALVVFRPQNEECHYRGHCAKWRANGKEPITREEFDRRIRAHYDALDMDAIRQSEGWDIAMVIAPVSEETDCDRILEGLLRIP